MSLDRPDYDPSELAGTGRHLAPDDLFTWTRFWDAARLIESIIARNLADEHGMTVSDYEVLVRLDGNGGAMRLRGLAEQCVSSKSKLTHTLDRLEQRRWIERRTADTDRRGVIAHLLPAGTQTLADVSAGHALLIEDHILAQWTDRERHVVGDAMAKAAEHMRKHRRAGGAATGV